MIIDHTRMFLEVKSTWAYPILWSSFRDLAIPNIMFVLFAIIPWYFGIAYSKSFNMSIILSQRKCPWMTFLCCICLSCREEYQTRNQAGKIPSPVPSLKDFLWVVFCSIRTPKIQQHFDEVPAFWFDLFE